MVNLPSGETPVAKIGDGVIAVVQELGWPGAKGSAYVWEEETAALIGSDLTGGEDAIPRAEESLGAKEFLDEGRGEVSVGHEDDGRSGVARPVYELIGARHFAGDSSFQLALTIREGLDTR